jgi:hypothetical protein
MFSLDRISKASAAFAFASALVSLPLLSQAQVSLVGALLTSNTSTGADATGGGYQYTTNTSLGFDTLTLVSNGTTYSKGISIPLSIGDNVFTFPNAGTTPGAFGGIELFLNSTGASYNPNGGGRPADLDVARDTASANPFFVPVAGTQLANYSTPFTVLPYGGASSFLVGGQTVSVTAFSDNTQAQGGFTLRVGAATAPSTPEPGSIALFTGFAISGGLFLKRRKK